MPTDDNRSPLARWKRPLLIAAGLLLLIGLLAGAYKLQRDPATPFLPVGGPGDWIKFPEQSSVMAWDRAERVTLFTAEFDVAQPVERAVLSFRAFRTVQISLDGVPVPGETDNVNWKHLRTVDLSPRLAPGRHVLTFRVSNEMGPPLLQAGLPAAGLRSNSDWSVSLEDEDWTRAWRVETFDRPPVAGDFPTASEALVKHLPLLLTIFIIALVLSLRPPAAIRNLLNRPHHFRWILLGAWLLLGLNNLVKLDLATGMDYAHHYAYIHHIVEHRALPLASEGGQAFQAPLFYVIAALMHGALGLALEHETVDRLLRFIPLACGLAQIEIAFRLLRTLLPDRAALRNVGLLVVALLPMNIYVSQVVGNEPLQGLFGALCVLVAARMLVRPDDTTPKTLGLLGVLFGAALLSKSDAILLGPPLLFVIAYWATRKNAGLRSFAWGSCLTFGVAATLSGWVYVRNWIHFDKLLVGGWDTAIGREWWQHPGYMTVQHFTTFGASLKQPVYASFGSFWDGLYSRVWTDGTLSGMTTIEYAPAWNYTSMIAGAWLGIVPTLIIFIGILGAFRPGRPAGGAEDAPALGSARSVLCFAVLTCFVSLLAILYHQVSVPFYSSAKPTYALAMLPCVAVLMSEGYGQLTRHRYARAATHAALASWACTAYVAFFIW